MTRRTGSKPMVDKQISIKLNNSTLINANTTRNSLQCYRCVLKEVSQIPNRHFQFKVEYYNTNYWLKTNDQQFRLQ